MSKELNKAPAEQAGGDERDLQAEGAQGEREAFEAAYPELISLCRWNEEKQEYNSGSGGLGWQDGLQATQWLRVWKKARAALAQPSQAIAAAPTYQFQSREIGESDWAPCDFRWYLYCSKSPEMDTRVVEVAAQPSPAQADEKPGDSILCYGCFAKGVGPEHFDEAGKCLAAQAHQAQHSVPDGVETFLDEVRAELLRARSKFPGDRIMTIALAEEFGELCKAVLDEPAANVRKEAVQTAVMAARVALDGDGSVTAWRAERGLDPLAAAPGKEVGHE